MNTVIEIIVLIIIAAAIFKIDIFTSAGSLAGWMVELVKFNVSLSTNILSMFGLFQNQNRTGTENQQFAGFFDRYKVLRGAHDGLVVGDYRLSLNDSFAHMAVMAPTGVGKTTKYVITNVLSLNHSMLITDPSGEISKATSGHLAAKGFEIKYLQPSDLKKSLRYNPLARVKNHDDVAKVVEILIGSAFPSPSGDQAFWNNQGKSILSTLIKTLMLQPEKFRNLANLKFMLNSFGTTGKDLNHLTSKLDEMSFSETQRS
jgi:type IV secretory pathway TraG/TraD family ATPase VirD4